MLQIPGQGSSPITRPDDGDVQRRPVRQTVRTRNTPIAEAAILRELLFKEKVKQWNAAGRSREKHSGPTARKTVRDISGVCSCRAPATRGRALSSDAEVEEKEPLNDLDIGWSVSGQLHHQNILTLEPGVYQLASGQGSAGVPGQRTCSGGDSGQRISSGHSGSPEQGTCSGQSPEQSSRTDDPGLGTCSGQAKQSTGDLGQGICSASGDLTSNMATSERRDTCSDAKLAQVLQGEEYGAEPNQDRAGTRHTLASSQDTQAVCRDTSRSAKRRRIPSPGQSGDYLLAKHVQEQADAEMAMQLQAGDGSGRWGSKQNSHTHWHKQVQERTDAEMAMQLQAGGGSGRWGSERNSHTHLQVQERIDAEMAMQLQEQGGGGHSNHRHDNNGVVFSNGRTLYLGDMGGQGDSASRQSFTMQQEAAAADQIDMSYESLLKLEDVSRGVDTSTLNHITSTHAYQERLGISEENRTCSVCQTQYIHGEELRTLPCLHTFHRSCVDRWLADHTQCPVCMKDIKEHQHVT